MDILRPASLLTCTALLLVASGCGKGGDDEDDGSQSGLVVVYHCGSITGTEEWAAENRRHVITCDVEVEGTLVIEGGAEVYLEPGTTLRVNGGRLDAVGGPNHQILFDSYTSLSSQGTAGEHGGIVSSDGHLDLSWVTVRYGGGEGGIIHSTGGTANMEYLTLSNGPSAGVHAEGTVFGKLRDVNLAYLVDPLVLPWDAPQVLSGVSVDSVENEFITLSDDTLSIQVSLPPQSLPYLSTGVHVTAAGELSLEGTLMLAGDVVVDGGIVIYGSYSDTVDVQAFDEVPRVLDITSSASTTTIRYTRFTGVTVSSAAPALFMKDSRFVDAPGDALTITGGIRDETSQNLEGNTFAGSGYGLVLPFGMLDLVGGHNDFADTAFDGPAAMGGALTSGATIVLSDLPGGQVLVLEDLSVTSGTLSLEDGAMYFATGAGLDVEGGYLAADAVSFLSLDETPGAWRGITIASESSSSSLDGCEVAYGGAGGGANVTLQGGGAVRDSVIRDSAGWGIYLGGAGSPTIEGNTYSANALGDVGPG